MICPLMSHQGEVVSISNYYERECLKEKCAWWDKFQEECAMLSLSKAIQSITDIKK